MSTLAEQTGEKNSKTNTKKLSKRQRQALKAKATKLQLKKTKKKRKAASKKTVSDSVPSTVKEISKTGVTGNASLKRKASSINGHSANEIKPQKQMKSEMMKSKPTNTETKQVTGKTNSKTVAGYSQKKNIQEKIKSGTVKSKLTKNKPKLGEQNSISTSPEIEIEPDKNWKELAKKLGIGSGKKKRQPETQKKEEPTTGETHLGKDMWFDDVEDIFIEPSIIDSASGIESKKEDGDVLPDRFITPGTKAVLTKCLAMDCEMVGIGPGGVESVLARISVVNMYGHCVYDKFVKAKEEVTDYRTWVSGVRPEDLETAETLEQVQKDINEMFKGRILVGHAIGNDEKVLFMNHPKKYIRDTQKYQGFRQLIGGRKPGLKMLTQKVLGVKIQSGEHSSVQDAQATMRLYTMIRKDWEKKIKERHILNKYHKQKITGKIKPKSKPKESDDEET